MSQRIALIGHCGPDGSHLRLAILSAVPGSLVTTLEDSEGLEKSLKGGLNLLLINRVLDYGFDEPDGVSLIRRLRQAHPNVKMIMVSNLPEAQSAAIAAGANGAFGKRDIGSPKVAQILRDALSSVGAPPV